MRSAIKHSLGQFNVAPILDFETNQNLETPYNYKNKTPNRPEITFDADFNPFKSGAKTAKYTMAKKSAEGWENLYIGLESGLGEENKGSKLQIEKDSGSGII